MQMEIDIEKLTEDELIELNHHTFSLQ